MFIQHNEQLSTIGRGKVSGVKSELVGFPKPPHQSAEGQLHQIRLTNAVSYLRNRAAQSQTEDLIKI